jgi:hypothetical protein
MSKVTIAAGAAMLPKDRVDPLEQAIREGVQRFVHELLEAEVTEALGRLR